MRSFVLAFISAFAVLATAAIGEESRRPNIVYFLVDSLAQAFNFLRLDIFGFPLNVLIRQQTQFSGQGPVSQGAVLRSILPRLPETQI